MGDSEVLLSDDNTNDKPEKTSQGSSVQALVRGLRVLRCFDADHPTRSFAEIKQQVGLAAATAFRLVKTLESEGFLALDQTSNRYHLGSGTLQTAFLATSVEGLGLIAAPIMHALAEETGETVNLSIWTEYGPLHIKVVLTPRPFKPIHNEGVTLPDICNATCKVLLAYGPARRRKSFLLKTQEPLTPYSIVAPEEVSSELEKVRREGIAFDLQEHDLGHCAVSAPVWDAKGEATAALTIVCPPERFGPEDIKRYVSALRNWAPRLSELYGYKGSQTSAEI
jgi:DNA-binding IclR family transcriptional regulator